LNPASTHLFRKRRVPNRFPRISPVHRNSLRKTLMMLKVRRTVTERRQNEGHRLCARSPLPNSCQSLLSICQKNCNQNDLNLRLTLILRAAVLVCLRAISLMRTRRATTNQERRKRQTGGGGAHESTVSSLAPHGQRPQIPGPCIQSRDGAPPSGR
jgi:hypothetical protein